MLVYLKKSCNFIISIRKFNYNGILVLYRKESTHFKLDQDGDIEYIRWGPSSQGAVLSQDPKVLEMYFYAHKKFTKFVESYPSQVQI